MHWFSVRLEQKDCREIIRLRNGYGNSIGDERQRAVGCRKATPKKLVSNWISFDFGVGETGGKKNHASTSKVFI